MSPFSRLLLASATCLMLAHTGYTQTATQPQFISSLNVTPGNSLTTSETPIYGGVLGSADFNRDGTLDVVTTYNPNGTAPVYALLLNKGDGSFTRQVLSNVAAPSDPTASTSVQVADVNGDGRPDLVIVNTSANNDGSPAGPSTLYVYLGNGDATFRALPPVVVSSNLDSAVKLARDFNGDGKPDLVIENFNPAMNQSNDSVWLNDGEGRFTLREQVPQMLTFLGAGNLYGNGRVDLVGGGGIGATIFKNNGDGTFTRGVSVGSVYGYDEKVTVGDLNRDGRDDLVIDGERAIANSHIRDSYVFLNEGNGKFRQTASFQSAHIQSFIADVNHDGNPDLVAATQAGTQVYPGNGNGTFGNPANYSTGFSRTGLPGYALADFNGDGNLDVLSGSNYIAFALTPGDRNGNFAAPRNVACCQYAYSIASGDFNKDGKPDIAVMNEAANGAPEHGSVEVFAGTGLGYLGPGKSYPIDPPAGVIATGDVNGDGKLDIVVTRGAGLPRFGNAKTVTDTSVLLGRGDGTFDPAANYHLVGPPPGNVFDTAVYLRDVNHDGKLDLVGDWGVALGNGDGTFKTPIPLPSGIQSIDSLAVGNFNHDGNLDMVVVDGGKVYSDVTTIDTLLGDGKGSFRIANREPFAAPGYPLSNLVALATADMNGDGITDILYTGYYINSTKDKVTGKALNVQLGRGDGTFAAAAKYPIESFGFEILTGDFNRDGRPDVVVFDGDSFNKGNLTLFKGSGGGKLFAVPEEFQTGDTNNLDGLAVVINLNGDTAPDIADLSSFGIERLLNTGAR